MNYLRGKRWITKRSSSNKKKNTSKPPRKSTMTRKYNKWSSAILSKRNSSSNSTPLSRSRWSSAKRPSLHRSPRAVLPGASHIDLVAILPKTGDIEKAN